jgi:hypothetical protein
MNQQPKEDDFQRAPPRLNSSNSDPSIKTALLYETNYSRRSIFNLSAKPKSKFGCILFGQNIVASHAYAHISLQLVYVLSSEF